MRLSVLTLGVAACFVGSVFQVAHAADADPCTAIKGTCVKSKPNLAGIPCSSGEGGSYTVLGKNDCCCKDEPAPEPAETDQCTALKSTCVKSKPNLAGIPCSSGEGGSYAIVENNDCCCKDEPSDQDNPPPTTPAPNPNPNKGNRPKGKGRGRAKLIRVPPRCIGGRRTRKQIIQCAQRFNQGRRNRRPGNRRPRRGQRHQ
ncbi:predicted protein [Lichtheimia corymbifera JMRC:FSU:9682]|uniref:Uncharacterized protein n=1 Tax=Lichtheimia corymbifera JMRC:FSU:9682 TaxID=1263082 RepID=A0A068RV26_9FUNG|nr:predicted protein [Lichtheimia corymbifera JMRC:FSU:9682]